MRLDDHSRAVHLGGFDHIRINRALSEPFHVLDFAGSRVENLNEILADNLSLRFRVGHSTQVAEESFCSVNSFDIQPHTLVGLKYFSGLVLSHQTGIHEDTMEVVADGTVQKHCGD